MLSDVMTGMAMSYGVPIFRVNTVYSNIVSESVNGQWRPWSYWNAQADLGIPCPH